MKFAIYGVSRSGKDYFINALIKYFSERGAKLEHIKGSETLNEFALNDYGLKFKQCDEVQKSALRKRFVSHVSKTDCARISLLTGITLFISRIMSCVRCARNRT